METPHITLIQQTSETSTEQPSPSPTASPISPCKFEHDPNDPLSRFHLTPTEKLFTNLAHCPPDREPVVLITNGSFCPIHKQHVNMIDQARIFLEAHFPVFVVTSFLSPSVDSYVEKKLFKGRRHQYHLNFAERAMLCELALEEHDRVEVDKWEGSQPEFYDFSIVMDHLQDFLDKECVSRGLRRAQVSLCVGIDMLKTKIHKKCLASGKSLVVVHRPGYPLSQFGLREDITPQEMWATKVFFAPTDTQDDVSSRLLHQLLMDGKPHYISGLVTEKVAQWLKHRWSQSNMILQSRDLPSPSVQVGFWKSSSNNSEGRW